MVLVRRAHIMMWRKRTREREKDSSTFRCSFNAKEILYCLNALFFLYILFLLWFAYLFPPQRTSNCSHSIRNRTRSHSHNCIHVIREPTIKISKIYSTNICFRLEFISFFSHCHFFYTSSQFSYRSIFLQLPFTQCRYGR